MGSVLFVEYPKCSTCRRAKAWLDEHGISYEDRHIVEEPPTAAELAEWRVRGELGVKARLDAGMGEDEALELLSTNGMLVKRPLLVGKDFCLVGFRETEWEAALC